VLFTSPLFLFVFLPLFLILYFLAPNDTKNKNYIALLGSILFFAWGEPIFVFALIGFTFIDYKASLLVTPESKNKNKTKKIILVTTILLNVLVLIISKYSNFIISELLSPFGNWQYLKEKTANMPLLLGISFITFHRISFLVDSYKGRAIPPRNFVDCLLYIFLFPQLIAGPIIRYHDIGKQIHERTHSVDNFLNGFYRFSIGLVKKMIWADPLGILADKVFALQPTSLPVSYAWGGIIAYTLQIYFDFSAYSDMAIGLARIMGFTFPENFNRPYIAKSITDFWQRWHISLSNWMRIYLYIPLGGNRNGQIRTYFNLWTVFLISGIWHGASWNFIAWGAYYGFFLSIERAFTSNSSFRIKIPSYLQQPLTLLAVMIGWVMFRAPTLTAAVTYLGSLLGLTNFNPENARPWGFVFSNREITALITASIFSCFVIPNIWLKYLPKFLSSPWIPQSSEVLKIKPYRTHSLQFLVIIFLILLSTSAIVSSNYVPFLYFRF
jgi:alginate O-acetyltransferase complex protein AlgI